MRDELAESGHYGSVITMHRQLVLSGRCEMLLFSATFSAEVTEIADGIIGTPFDKLILRNDQLALSNILYNVSTWKRGVTPRSSRRSQTSISV